MHIDQEYLLNDAFAIYKDPGFNPKRPLRIIFGSEGERSPGVDAGGLLRQFYSSFFGEVSNPYCSNTRLFEGEAPYFLPISTAETCLSEIFVVIGKMISHYICQGGEGFPALAPSVYKYLQTGSVKDSLLDLSIKEVASPIYCHFINEVNVFG